MKQRFARPAAFSMRQPVMDVASHVVFDVLPRNQILLATLQSRLMSPQGCFGVK